MDGEKVEFDIELKQDKSAAVNVTGPGSKQYTQTLLNLNKFILNKVLMI
jgi:hypothetical protein